MIVAWCYQCGKKWRITKLHLLYNMLARSPCCGAYTDANENLPDSLGEAGRDERGEASVKPTAAGVMWSTG